MTPAMARTSYSNGKRPCNFSLRNTALGDLEWDGDSELWFAQGLPGFERQSRIVPIEIAAQRPLAYLQSATDPTICFMALPMSSIAPGMQVRLEPDDYQVLGLDPSVEPVPGLDILCLALLGPGGLGSGESGIQANLSSPVVINLHNHRGHQLIPESGPSYWRLGATGEWEAACS